MMPTEQKKGEDSDVLSLPLTSISMFHVRSEKFKKRD